MPHSLVYWAYTVIGIIVAEVFYLLVRWHYGTPEYRARVWEAIWGYMLSWVAIASILAVLNEAGSITSVIASSFNIPVVKPSSSYIRSLLESEVSGWVIFWTIVALFRAIGSISIFGVQIGALSAIADYMTRITSIQWWGFQLYITDLAILYVLTLFWEYFTNYGLWAVTASLILPRSTRGIGATLTSYYLILTIMLPIMYGMATIEQPYTLPVVPPWAVHCMSNNIPSMIACYTGAIIEAGITTIFNLNGGSPVNGFYALVWDLILAITYALSFTIAYYIARLVDYGAFRLLDVIV